MAEPLPDQSDVRKRRTIVYIDAIDYDGERVVRCTVAGVALPEGCVSVFPLHFEDSPASDEECK
jgi:hypothetical protein